MCGVWCFVKGVSVAGGSGVLAGSARGGVRGLSKNNLTQWNTRDDRCFPPFPPLPSLHPFPPSLPPSVPSFHALHSLIFAQFPSSGPIMRGKKGGKIEERCEEVKNNDSDEVGVKMRCVG